MQTNRRFFVDEKLIQDNVAKIEDEEFNHLKNVLRAKIDEDIILNTGDGFDYFARIKEINKDNILAQIFDKKLNENQPKLKLTLFQALPKGDKIDLIVQKAVELGVYRLVPFTSAYTIVKDNPKKAERLNKISVEACKQCGRPVAMKIENTFSFKQMISQLKNFDLVIFAFEGEEENEIKNVLTSLNKVNSIAVIIGSEGGFSKSESSELINNGAKVVSLGKRILRAETAAIVVPAIIMYQFDEMVL